MKKGTIILICIAGALLLFAGFCITKYNGLVDANAEVEKLATANRMATVAVIDILPTTNDVGNGVA